MSDGKNQQKKKKQAKGTPALSKAGPKASNPTSTAIVLPPKMVVGGTIPALDRQFFKDFVTVHPKIMQKYMLAAKAGKLPQRTVHHGGNVAAGEHSLLWWMAQQLSDAIIGPTPQETLARGRSRAAASAESHLLKAAKAASSGQAASVPLVFKSNIPKTNFSLRIVKGKRRGSNQIHTTLEVTGTDIIGAVTYDAATVKGDVLFDQVLAPGAFNETRLQQFSYLFDKYQFEDIKFEYCPVVDATTDGAVIAFPDYDPDDDMFTHDTTNLRKAAAHIGSAMVQVWDHHVWDFHSLKKDVLLFTDPASTDDRLTQQGRFTILAASDMGEAKESGLVMMRYKCHFFITQIDNNPPFVGVGYEADGNGSTAAKPFGSTVTVKPGSNMSMAYTGTGTNSVFTFPTGATTHKYLIVMAFAGTGFTADTPATVAVTAPDTYNRRTYAVTSTTKFQEWGTFTIGGTNITHSVTISLAAATSFTLSSIYIAPIPEDFQAKRNKFVVKDEVYELKEQVAELKKLMESINSSDSEDLAVDLPDRTDLDKNPSPAQQAMLKAATRSGSPQRK